MPMDIVGDGPLSPSMIVMSTSQMKGTITLNVHGLMVCYCQHNTLTLWKSFRWLRNASGPLDIPLMEDLNYPLIPINPH